MELELENVRKEVSRIRNVSRHVILRSRIKELVTARGDRSNALVFQAKVPPGLVVVFRFDFTGKDFPSPLIDQQTEWKECNFFQGAIEQQADIARRIGRFIEETDSDQVLRCDRECNRIADGFM